MSNNDLPNILEMPTEMTGQEKQSSCYLEVLTLLNWPKQMADFLDVAEVKH